MVAGRFQPRRSSSPLRHAHRFNAQMYPSAWVKVSLSCCLVASSTVRQHQGSLSLSVAIQFRTFDSGYVSASGGCVWCSTDAFDCRRVRARAKKTLGKVWLQL
eukprot:5374541-Amphidinium_carterae.1